MELRGFRAIAEIMRNVLTLCYRLDINCATALMMLTRAGKDGPADGIDHVLARFRIDVEREQLEVQRFLQYLQLVGDDDPETFLLKLINISGRYLDEQTLQFLERISRIVPEEMRTEVERRRNRLALRIRTIDSRQWTG